MTVVNIHEAKTHLSKLLNRAVGGEEIVIARGGKAIARLVPVALPQGRRILGLDAGKIRLSEDFDAPLPAALLDDFES